MLLGARLVNAKHGLNFHEIIPGEFYRSGQPTSVELREIHGNYGIKTLIDLRDEDRGATFDEERKTAHALGIKVLEFPLSSKATLSPTAIDELRKVMTQAEKPVLIHCEHGANRTGLASAVYVFAVAEQSDFSAQLQLSPLFGHIPVEGTSRYAMSASWSDYRKWFRAQ